jgi:hypothetical protein
MRLKTTLLQKAILNECMSTATINNKCFIFLPFAIQKPYCRVYSVMQQYPNFVPFSGLKKWFWNRKKKFLIINYFLTSHI